MKITNSQLKQIIKEEISKVLSENEDRIADMTKFMSRLEFSPETKESDIKRYAKELVDNEVEPQDFASGELEWRDLVGELDIPIQDAKLIAFSMKRSVGQ